MHALRILGCTAAVSLRGMKLNTSNSSLYVSELKADDTLPGFFWHGCAQSTDLRYLSIALRCWTIAALSMDGATNELALHIQ